MWCRQYYKNAWISTMSHSPLKLLKKINHLHTWTAYVCLELDSYKGVDMYWSFSLEEFYNT